MSDKFVLPVESELARRIQAEGASPAVAKYQQKMKEGPVSDEDIASHMHLINAIKSFEEGYKNVHWVLYGSLRDELEEVSAETRRFLARLNIPMGLVADPAPKKKLFIPGRRPQD